MENKEKPKIKINLVPLVLGLSGLASIILGGTAIGIAVTQPTISVGETQQPTIEGLTNNELDNRLSTLDFVNTSKFDYEAKSIIMRSRFIPSDFLDDNWEKKLYNVVATEVFTGVESYDYNTVRFVHSQGNEKNIYFTFKARKKNTEEIEKIYLTKIISK